MVTFNELRISDDYSCLLIDCEIERVDIYKNMYIKSVYLEYYKNANAASMPSSKAVCIYENTNDDNKVRAVRLSVAESALGRMNMGTSTFRNGLFYVIVNCDGTLPHSIPNYPCGYDDQVKIGAILDWKAFYNTGMSYVNSLFNGCNPCPDLTGFEHFAVLWEALKMALSTCDWNLVSDLWDKFLLSPDNPFVQTSARPSGCGCR